MSAQMSPSAESKDLSIPVQVNPTAWERKFLAEDATEDPFNNILTPATINRQPLEAYLYYAARERLREENDYRTVPDAPWDAVLKKITGQLATTPKSPGQQQQLPASRPQRGLPPSQAPQPDVESARGIRDWFKAHRRRGQHPSVPSDARRLSSQNSHGNSDAFDGKGTSTSIELVNRSEDLGYYITPHERETAYRIMRVSSWQVVMYLIYTDMVGWFSSSKVFQLIGYGPGVLVYTCFWMLAFCCGQVVWKLYMSLDSERYPIKSYGDIADRTYGPWFRNLVNLAQFAQLTLVVGTLITMNSQAALMIAESKFCFLILTLIFAVVGFALSHFRTLRGVSVFAFINFYLNVVAMCLLLFSSALDDPTPGPQTTGIPVETAAWIPKESSTWDKQVLGVELAVMAYGGSLLFAEFMAEMRRPRDFWKAALVAQIVLYGTYMFTGLFIYSMQGQYANIFPLETVTNKAFQAVIGVLNLIITICIGLLFSHIASKMLYRIILRGCFNRPSISSPKSRPWWALTVAFYWSLAWVISSLIPSLLDLSTIIASVLALPFTYILPPVLLLGHWIQRDALSADGPWRPGMAPYSNRIDTWKSFARWRRGFVPYWYLKVIIMVMVILATGFMVIAIWAAAISLRGSYESQRRVFSCTPPRPV